MKKILDQYILKKFFINFIYIILSFTIIFIIVDIIDNIDKFISRGISNKEMFDYYLLSVPSYISVALPMTLLIATIITFVTLQKNNEITALKASGISIYRISSSLILIGVIFCFISFYFENIIVMNTFNKRIPIENKLKNKKTFTTKKSDIYYHLDNAFLAIKHYNYNNDTGKNISIQFYNGPDLVSRIDAEKMVWDKETDNWKLKEIKLRKWINGKVFFTTKPDSLINIKDLNPSIIKKDNINPEEMNYWELSSFISKLKNKGLSYTRWSVNKFFKTAFCCSSLIMILFGITLSITSPRSNYSTGIGLSIVVIFLYYLLIKLGQSLGYNDVLSPFLSVWFVNILFIIFGAFMLLKTRT
jgi:lipopolysaccharide export system permease protein